LTPRSLLLIDADPAVQDYLTHLLQRDDREIEHTAEAREALNRLRAAPVDVVLAGQGSNGFDGLKFLRQIRSVSPDTRIILTGEPDPARIVRAVRQRAFSYFHKPLPAGPLVEMVQHAMEATGWQDDIRVMSARPEWITFEVRCKIEAADRTTHFLREMTSDLPPQTCEDIAASFRELLMNGIEHGGKNDPRKRVRASLLRMHKSVIGYIHDPGSGFSLDFLPHAAISNPADAPIRHVEIRAEEGKRPGGFGILMTRNMVDELVYNERGNAVLFVKYL
jgi:two-component system, OmpR family, response regulator